MAKKKSEAEAADTTPAPAEKLSKADAVRRAIADGVDSPSEGVAYVRSKFGIEITNQQFSTVKFQDKKKGGKKPKAEASPAGMKSAARVTGGSDHRQRQGVPPGPDGEGTDRRLRGGRGGGDGDGAGGLSSPGPKVRQRTHSPMPAPPI